MRKVCMTCSTKEAEASLALATVQTSPPQATVRLRPGAPAGQRWMGRAAAEVLASGSLGVSPV
jgi:hypothetical protein